MSGKVVRVSSVPGATLIRRWQRKCGRTSTNDKYLLRTGRLRKAAGPLRIASEQLVDSGDAKRKSLVVTLLSPFRTS